MVTSYLGVKIVRSEFGKVLLIQCSSFTPTSDRCSLSFVDGELSQIITHPAISVWAVSTMPNGDIVSGCSDGIVRVFSASEERHASSADLKEYEEQVASQAISAEQAGDIKQTDLPGPEALKAPGKLQLSSYFIVRNLTA